jgi:hypothetical protein
MPCYCDIPDEENQAEIEKRCKINMYFDAQYILTKEQVAECEKRGLKRFPLDDVNDHLCKICKVLTEEQMKEIGAYYFQIKWPHKTLYDWYLKHIEDDNSNKKSRQ